ncbi:MAG: cofactor-independent phosphoglycerate mutase [Prevotella sp.]
MKHIIILGDGMADHAVESLDGKTLLQYASTPYMNMLARNGRTGMLRTIPEGFLPGSEVANTAILGYNLNKVYEGRGPLEAASIGYDMEADDLALRCNIITLGNGKIINHHGGHLTTEDSDKLIKYLNQKLGNDKIKFITGIQYRHLLIIKGGNKHIVCAPPHDNPDKEWRKLMIKPEEGWADKKDGDKMTAQETANLLNSLIEKSQQLLEEHELNKQRTALGKLTANSIWPWGGGYRPRMQTLQQMFPQIKQGDVISAVDLIRGIGKYAGLNVITPDGCTGMYDTNYENKAKAALDMLREHDFVFLHIEASDEAGHDGDIGLKLKTIENLDKRIVKPIYEEIKNWDDQPVCMAVLPDHPTPVEIRTHMDEPVPFLIWHKGIQPDSVDTYDEVACRDGVFGTLILDEFIKTFMAID